MKKYLLFALLALWLCNALNAQPYRLFIPKVDYLYTDQQNYYHGFRIIKTDTGANGDSILIPFYEKIFYWDRGTRSIGSWISPQIIEKQNGINILYNLNYDTIILKTKAILNEFWDCYNFNNGARIEAKITRWDTISFLEMTDSAKTISFAYFDSTNTRKPNRVDSFNIVLSKNYGLIQTFNFIFFPNIQKHFYYQTDSVGLKAFKISGFNKTMGIKNLITKNIFNFQPGDEMDILMTQINTYPIKLSSDTTKIKQTILIRVDSVNKLSYKIREINYNILYDKTGTHTKYIDTTKWESYIFNNKKCQLDYLPGLKIPSGTPDFIQIFSSTLNSFHNGRMQKILDDDFCTFFNLTYYYENDSTYSITVNDGCFSYPTTFIEGLGGPYYNYVYYNYVVNEKKLVYYKKGSETWGVPLSLKPGQIHNQNQLIQIYPNPWNSSSTISVSTLTEGKIQIITQLGQVAYEKDISAGQNTISLYKENFKPGVYFLKLIRQNGLLTSKMFVVQ